jgi:hypothetical protein
MGLSCGPTRDTLYRILLNGDPRDIDEYKRSIPDSGIASSFGNKGINKLRIDQR